MKKTFCWGRRLVKLNGGHRNEVYLDKKRNHVRKTYLGGLQWSRVLRDFYFHLYSPFAPPVLKISKRLHLYVGYVRGSKPVSLPELLTNGRLKKIVKALRRMHQKDIFKKIKDVHKTEGKLDYAKVAQRYLNMLKGKENAQLVKTIFSSRRQFNLLNDQKDLSLIHGDLALHNILFQRRLLLTKRIYFVDGEAEWIKTNKSIGSRYYDVGFFIGHNILTEAYRRRLVNGEKFDPVELKSLTEKFLEEYAPKNHFNKKKLLKAMALYFLAKAAMHEKAIKEKKEAKDLPGPVRFLIKEASKDMAVRCLRARRLSSVIDYFCQKYMPAEEK